MNLHLITGRHMHPGPLIVDNKSPPDLPAPFLSLIIKK